MQRTITYSVIVETIVTIITDSDDYPQDGPLTDEWRDTFASEIEHNICDGATVEVSIEDIDEDDNEDDKEDKDEGEE